MKKLKVDFNNIIEKHIYSNKVFLGESKLRDDLKNYTFGKDSIENIYIFDVFLQIKLIRKVCMFLSYLKKKRKKIVFFGLKGDGLNFTDKELVMEVNKSIFDLCFIVKEGSNKIKIQKILDEFFFKIYNSKNPDSADETKISNLVFKFSTFIRNKELNEEIEVNGMFLDHWENGFFSNYHCFQPSINFPIKNMFYSNKSTLKKKSKENLRAFSEKYRNLYFVSEFYNKYKKKPGAVVFFSKEGYDSFFKEFKRLGIPTICILNSGDSLKGVDYPLLGNKYSIKVLSFYRKLFRYYTI
jgi:ribosomal protein S2